MNLPILATFVLIFVGVMWMAATIAGWRYVWTNIIAPMLGIALFMGGCFGIFFLMSFLFGSSG